MIGEVKEEGVVSLAGAGRMKDAICPRFGPIRSVTRSSPLTVFCLDHFVSRWKINGWLLESRALNRVDVVKQIPTPFVVSSKRHRSTHLVAGFQGHQVRLCWHQLVLAFEWWSWSSRIEVSRKKLIVTITGPLQIFACICEKFFETLSSESRISWF